MSYSTFYLYIYVLIHINTYISFHRHVLHALHSKCFGSLNEKNHKFSLKGNFRQEKVSLRFH